ncbi:amino acid deaminase [Saccharomonospora sp. NPDC006951]
MTPVITSGRLDTTALRSAGEENLDWRFKAVPSSLWGRSLATAADERPDLFTGGFLGPVVVLEAEPLEHNLRTMAAWCAERGVALAPHGKTTMAPQLFAKQFDNGAWGITAANAAQLRVYRAFGVSRVLLANQLVDPAALRWLADELDDDPAFEFCCWVDSVRGVELMTEALAGARRQVDVLLELGPRNERRGRTGVRDEETAMAVARAAAASPALRLTGVGGYEGALEKDTTERALAHIESYVDTLRETTIRLAETGLLSEETPVVVSAGGSVYFDKVAQGLTTGWPSSLDAFQLLPVLRSGAYLTHDDGRYREVSPLGAHPRVSGPPLRSALRAWAQVTSMPTSDLALLTMGKRDVSFDEGLPEPQSHRDSTGTVRPLEGHTVGKLNDQHTYLTLPPGSPLAVGDWVGFGLSHPCTVFDKWPVIPVVGEDRHTVVDFIRTYF